MAILTSADYPAVRYALRADGSLTATALPDAVIGNAVYLGEAEAEMLERYPAALTEVDAARVAQVKTATIYLLGALLAFAIPTLKSETWGGYTYQLATVDWASRAVELRSLADQVIARLIGETTVALRRPTSFTLAHARRRWSLVP